MSRLILVADDDPAIRKFLAEVLSDEGFDVVMAPDGHAALERAQEYPPTLILLDYRMPVCNGRQFLARYRRQPGPHAPVVLLSAEASASRRAAEVGADAYLGKPFDLPALFGLVERYAR
jgi:CheY-like chemotaxis protein